MKVWADMLTKKDGQALLRWWRTNAWWNNIWSQGSKNVRYYLAQSETNPRYYMLLRTEDNP